MSENQSNQTVQSQTLAAENESQNIEANQNSGESSPQNKSNVDAPSLDSAVKDAIAAEPKNLARKLKVKIDGNETELDESEVIAGYQLRRASDGRFQEAAKLRQQAEEVIKLLKTNPRAALQHPAIGADVRKLAEEILQEELENELLDPKDREIRTLKSTLKAKEDAERQAQETVVAKEKKQAEAEYMTKYETGIKSALQQSGLPLTNLTATRMIHYLKNAMAAGYDAEPSDVVELVREDYVNEIKQLFGASDGTTLASLLGEDGLKKVRQHDISRLKSPTDAPKPAPVDDTDVDTKSRPKSKGRNLKDLFKDIDDKYGD